MYPNGYIRKQIGNMPAFGKKRYTTPVVGRNNNDVSKDWYVFFRYKHEGRVYKFKRREGINRIKDPVEKLKALHTLYNELCYDLRHGWNPILDPKREIDYKPNKQMKPKEPIVRTRKLKKMTKAELKQHFNNKRITY